MHLTNSDQVDPEGLRHSETGRRAAQWGNDAARHGAEVAAAYDRQIKRRALAEVNISRSERAIQRICFGWCIAFDCLPKGFVEPSIDARILKGVN